MKDYEGQFTDIWRKYEKSRDYIDKKALVRRTDECWRFYLGDQWHGLESGGERLPMLNFIKPIVRYKTAVVAQNAMIANYSPADGDEDTLAACELLNEHFRQSWEKGKMDSNLWDIVRAAQIQGDAYLFYGTPSDMEPQILPNVNVLFADEQEQNIQSQPYLMIYERRFVRDIREEAKRNKIPPELIDTITADDETDKQLGNITEIDQSSATDGKCASILYLAKDSEGIVHIARSTKTCVYQQDTRLQATDYEGNYVGVGLKSYPIVSFIWERIPNSARGQSEVRTLIPNQLELNKTLARRSMAVKMCAFPRLAYDSNAVTNPDALDNVGVKIKLSNTNAQSIREMIQYLEPQSMSNDAKSLSDELMKMTRELAGAGDIATGSVDPTQASGAAIIAVKNQNELPLNENVATKTQFVEDLALLWFDIWAAYNPNGIEVETEGETGEADEQGQPVTGMIKQTIPPEVLERMKVHVRVDVSQANPFSKLAQEQALERMLQAQQLTFEEYIEALDDDSNVPKRKIQDILKKRQQQQMSQQQSQLQQAAELLQQQNQTIAQLSGGQPGTERTEQEAIPNEMPIMQ